MFFEVCLLSLGLFTGSELYKKIESSFGDKSNRSPQKKKEPLMRSRAVAGSPVPENKEFRSALDSLTQEVSQLRQDFSEYVNTTKKPPVQTGAVSPPMRQQESVLPSSIFEKLIEENVTLRKGERGE